ncbi:hypothetical protein A4A49_25773 [Nicotiana attenuata]|uniref:Uncharacterized protein n=1 Tax=Nicotiana attenuata TaxID=49451 RepID=A0A1J6KE10_NICAT|nr:hypothetical protein A4A49_25773 [Nicotiana attenuata]
MYLSLPLFRSRFASIRFVGVCAGRTRSAQSTDFRWHPAASGARAPVTGARSSTWDKLTADIRPLLGGITV